MIQTAIQRDRLLDFVYIDKKGNASYRVVEPVKFDGKLLHGVCLLRGGEIRAFLVERMYLVGDEIKSHEILL